MQLKIMTLNIWGYNGDWNKRLKNIITLLSKEKPDVIVMQEVCDDRRFNRKGNHQGIIINSKLNYPYSNYLEVEKILTRNKLPVKELIYEGQLVLSKHPIVKVNNRYLKQQKDNRHQSALQQISLKIGNKMIEVWNIHFSNRDDWSKLHLQETMSYVKKPTIIIGDFNIQIFANTELPRDINAIINKTHINSYNFKKYVSYPRGNVILDYILIPKQYKFLKVKCAGNNISDHKAIIATIKTD
jgi:endonuclease/exonuclease/phosphatase family metal-dependent hydrolase